MADSIQIMRYLQEAFSDPDRITGDKFEVLRHLSQMVNTEGNESAQEFVLRALNQREQFGELKPILDALIRKVGLFPYLDPGALSTADQIAYEFHRPLNMNDDIVFHGPQANIYRKLLNKENVVLSAPTSFGKSLIIDAIIASNLYRNIVIVVPTIALIDETRRRLVGKFNKTYKIITHASQTRQEKNIYILTQERVLEFGSLEEVDFFAIDEFYKLSPTSETDRRSLLLNQALYKLMKNKCHFYMLGPHISGISQEFRKRIEFTFINEPYQTVISEIKRTPVNDNEIDALITLCKELDDPTIIFCSSPKRAQMVSEALSVNLNVKSSANLASAIEWIGSNYDPDWHFVKALKNNIGVHHGRIPRSLAQYALRKFNEGALKYLVCTSTLIEGVNSIAKNIVVFDNKISRKKIDLFTFNNIRGRSGRMFQHVLGYVYIFHEPPETGYPTIDIPIYSQPSSSPESLLIQIDEKDLSEKSRDRLKKYNGLSFIGYDVLKENYGVEPDFQVNLAHDIASNPKYFHKNLFWTADPSYEQLVFISKLMWDYFQGGKLGSGSAKSYAQVATYIKKLEAAPAIRDLLKPQIKYLNSNNKGDIDDALQQILDFIDLWATFNFPRLLRVIDKIQRDVFGRMKLQPGSYEAYAKQVENLFLDPSISMLDEYGIPLELAKKLTHFMKSLDGNLDETLKKIQKLPVESLGLSEFEIELINDAKQYF